MASPGILAVGREARTKARRERSQEAKEPEKEKGNRTGRALRTGATQDSRKESKETATGVESLSTWKQIAGSRRMAIQEWKAKEERREKEKEERKEERPEET